SLAERYGAEIHRNEAVEEFTERNGRVLVRTRSGEYEAGRLIVSAGPWLPMMLARDYATLFTVYRQVLVWLDIAGPIEPFLPGTFPVFIWELQNSAHGVYGFPAIDGPRGGLKIATEQYDHSTTADSVTREVGEAEVRAFYDRLVAPRFPGLTGRSVKAVSCLYTVTPDSGFVIDTHPEYASVIVASPCSGHGFKHSAAIGEALAQVVIDGKSALDLSRFGIARLTRGILPV
ncbi:MAG TPA: FAD-dependent oxidoreductase, partial [Vicinamibacterales bacterium]|nr:FAD-dependent oxidoreductase [Vicinamibacterales bacterium]